MRYKWITKVILVLVLLVLVGTFLVCYLISLKDQGFNFIDNVSGVSTFIIALLAIINAFIISRQIDLLDNQIAEMKSDRLLRDQPFLILNDLSFYIEKPRLFFSPHEGIEFLSRYYLDACVTNVMNNPALFVDVQPELNIKNDTETMQLRAVTSRLNIVTKDDNTNIKHCQFAGDNSTLLYHSLRNDSALITPKLVINIYYTNASGGYFFTSYKYHIIPHDDIEIIREWHMKIIQAPIKYKEQLSILNETENEERWNILFNQIKKDFNDGSDKYNDLSEDVKLGLFSIPEAYQLKQITEEEYNKIEKHYSRFIKFPNAPCINEDVED